MQSGSKVCGGKGGEGSVGMHGEVRGMGNMVKCE
jgi:hypothetical protein